MEKGTVKKKLSCCLGELKSGPWYDSWARVRCVPLSIRSFDLHGDIYVTLREESLDELIDFLIQVRQEK